VNLGFGAMDYFTSMIPYVPASFHTPNMITTNGALCSVHYATELVQSCFRWRSPTLPIANTTSRWDARWPATSARPTANARHDGRHTARHEAGGG